MATKKVVPCTRLKKMMALHPEINRGVKKHLKTDPASVQRLNDILESGKGTQETVAAISALLDEKTAKKRPSFVQGEDVAFLGTTHPDTGVITGFTVGLSSYVGFEIAMHGPDIPAFKQVVKETLPALETRAQELKDKQKFLEEAREAILEAELDMRVVESTVEHSLLVYKESWSRYMELAMDLPVMDFFYANEYVNTSPPLR